MSHWKCLSNFRFLCFQKKKLYKCPPQPSSWNPSCWPDNKFTLEALTACVSVEGKQVTSHFPLSGTMNTSRGTMSTSKSLLPQHPKGQQRPISLSARRAFQRGRCDCRRWDGEEGEAIHARLASRMGSNNCKLCPPLHEKCVSADGQASGLELIAKRKDGVNSRWIDGHVIGYVSTWLMGGVWELRHPHTWACLNQIHCGNGPSFEVFSKTPGLKPGANNVRGTKGEERIRRCLRN